MKKFLTLAIVAIISLMANAQALKVKKSVRMPVAQMAASIDGADIWGYYLGGANNLIGLGTESTGTFGVAIKVPGNGALNGAKIQGINLPVMTTKMTNVTVFGGTTLGSSNLFTKSVTVTNTGYQTITLDDEVTIPSSGMYVGYKFTISSTSTEAEKYPMGTAEGAAAGALYLSLDGKTFNDYSTAGYGMSGLQLYVTDLQLTDHGLTINGVHAEASAIGGKGAVQVTVGSDNKSRITSVGYTINLNGADQEGTVNLSNPIPSGLLKSGVIDLPYNAPNELGSFPATVKITHVNGQPNEITPNPISFTVNTVTRIVPRMTVVEEYTGTQCGWCPRGWVGMEAVKHNQSNKALVIAWHNYNSSDAMYQASYANIPFSGAPQCTVDRKVYPDPYYGEAEEGIMECVNTYNTSVPTVDITKLTARFADEENKQINVTSETELLANGSGYTIAYVLTADELSGTTTAWKQSNYYTQYGKSTFKSYLPEMPELIEFCAGGSYGKSSVALTFNDAMIGSSYNTSGKSQIPAFTKSQAGDVESSEYTLNMPTKVSLLNAINYEKVYVTALVIAKDGSIANAKRVRVLGATEKDPNEGPEPIPGSKVSPITEECQIMGENMSANAKYVVGTNYATYAPVVWDVETGVVTDYADYEEGAFHGVNNDGLAVGDDGDHALAFKADGTKLELYHENGEEVETEWGTAIIGEIGSSAWDVSADGKTIAGFHFDAAYNVSPCIWNENGERTTLTIPAEKLGGVMVDGGGIRWMSDDASVLAGYVIDNMGTWPAAIWTKNAEGGYDFNFIAANYWEEDYQQGKPYMVFTPKAISHNGEWLSVQVQEEFDFFDFSKPAPTLKAARLNLKSGQLEVIAMPSDLEGQSMEPAGIADDGTLLMYTAVDGLYGRSGYVAGPDAVVQRLDDNLMLCEGVPEFGGNIPCAITPDAKKIQGFGLTGEGNIFSYIFDVQKFIDGIKAPTTQGSVASGKIYNLQGQQVKNMNARGLYITDGKKLMK